MVVVDFEFAAIAGERPVPVCLVAHELRGGRRFRIFHDQFGPAPPYATGRDVFFVAFYASADLGCYRALGWPMPERILDPFVEFRDRTNGLPLPAGSSLFGALTYFGLDALVPPRRRKCSRRLAAAHGEAGLLPRKFSIIARGRRGARTPLFAMLPRIDLPRALLRGRYMAAAAAMERDGTPIDTEMLAFLRHGWSDIQDQLIAEIDRDYGVFDGRTFKLERFAHFLPPRACRGHAMKAAN